MRTVLPLVAVLGFVAGSARADEKPAPAAPPKVDYLRDIEPILHNNCVYCHGGPKGKNGLRLDSIAAMLKGGKSGPALVPGKGAESLMVRKSDVQDKLPHKGSVLGREETALLKAWIDQGAKATVKLEVDKLPPDLAKELTDRSEKK